MPKQRLKKPGETVISHLAAGDRQLLDELCPCRNRILDTEVWREVLRIAREGDRHSRKRAAHAIATLLAKAQTSAKWRELLQTLDPEFELTVQDPKANGHLIGQIAHQAGHAHTLKESGLKTLRHQRRVLDLSSPEALADWVSRHLGLKNGYKISKRDPGIDRLWRWVKHRTEFQKRRRLSEDELLQKAAQWLPHQFAAAARSA